MKVFNKEEFLKDSKEMFLNISKELEEKNICPDYTHVLGEVIEFFYNEYTNESILAANLYPNETIEDAYEFDEDNIDDFQEGTPVLSTYDDILAYFTLNHLFNEEYEEELEEEL